MPQEVYADTDAYTIEWDTDLAAVVVGWHTTATGEAYRQGMDDCLALIEREDATKAMGDCRTFERFESTDREWTLEAWMPRLLETTLQYGAVVYPEDTIARVEMDQVARANLGVPVEQMFATEPTEARAWLRCQ